MVPLRPHATTFLVFGLFLLSSLHGVPRARAQTQGPPTYLVTDLGIVPGGTSSVGYAINAQGQVAGGAGTSAPSVRLPTQDAVVSLPAVPALASEGLRQLDLGGLNFASRYGAGSVLRYNFALGINSRGQTVGYGSPDSDQEEGLAFIADADGGNLRALAAPGDRRSSFARAINERGQVTGTAELAGGRQVFITGPDGAGPLRNIDPEPPSVDRLSTGRAINARGQVAGYMGYGSPFIGHAFLSGPDGAPPLKDLGTFGGYRSYAYAVNDAGQVAGTASISGYTRSHAFLSAPDGGALQDLSLPTDSSVAYGVNNRAEVVGYFAADSGPSHAFYYRAEAGGAHDLNTLIDPASGWELTAAYAINDAGQITGAGTINGQNHAFLLTPIPPAVPLPAGVSVVGTPARGGFVVSRTEGLDRPVTVLYHNGGSANRGVDYVTFPGTLSFSAGQSEALIPVTLLPGANRQKKVKVFLDPAPEDSYQIGKAQSKVFLSDLP